MFSCQDEYVDRVRLDKWLWAARFTKTRTAATELVLAGHVKVGGERVKPAREIATGETLEIVPRFLITGRRVTGTSFGGVKGRTQVPQLVDRWLAGEIDVEALLSHRLRLDQVNHGFELLEAQDGIRSVITFD